MPGLVLWRLTALSAAASPQGEALKDGLAVSAGSAGAGLLAGLVVGYAGMAVNRATCAPDPQELDHGGCAPIVGGLVGFGLGEAVAQPAVAGLTARHVGRRADAAVAGSLVMLGVSAFVVLTALPGDDPAPGLTAGAAVGLVGMPLVGGIAAASAPERGGPGVVVLPSWNRGAGVRLAGQF